MERLTRREGGASSFYQGSPIGTEVQGITSFAELPLWKSSKEISQGGQKILGYFYAIIPSACIGEMGGSNESPLCGHCVHACRDCDR